MTRASAAVSWLVVAAAILLVLWLSGETAETIGGITAARAWWH